MGVPAPTAPPGPRPLRAESAASTRGRNCGGTAPTRPGRYRRPPSAAKKAPAGFRACRPGISLDAGRPFRSSRPAWNPWARSKGHHLRKTGKGDRRRPKQVTDMAGTRSRRRPPRTGRQVHGAPPAAAHCTAGEPHRTPVRQLKFKSAAQRECTSPRGTAIEGVLGVASTRFSHQAAGSKDQAHVVLSFFRCILIIHHPLPAGRSMDVR